MQRIIVESIIYIIHNDNKTEFYNHLRLFRYFLKNKQGVWAPPGHLEPLPPTPGTKGQLCSCFLLISREVETCPGAPGAGLPGLVQKVALAQRQGSPEGEGRHLPVSRRPVQSHPLTGLGC